MDAPVVAVSKKRRHKPGKGERERLKQQQQKQQQPAAPTDKEVDTSKTSVASGEPPHQRSSSNCGNNRNNSNNRKKMKTTALPVTAPPPPREDDEQTGPVRGYSFEVDYNDHFETPLVAYQDLLPALALIGAGASVAPRPGGLTIYDPYFCQGRANAFLRQLLGPDSTVINRNRDFYQDVRQGAIPKHDLLITNPPYSGDHKQRLLTFLLSRDSVSDSDSPLPGTPPPFCLLLPAYTATKSYWCEFAESLAAGKGTGKGAAGRQYSFLYLMPERSYEYDHPEGTGKDTPPFYSCWFVGGVFSPQALDAMERALVAANPSLVVLRSVADMIARKYVTQKRLKPSRRKKLRA